MKILLLDIETAPILARVWQLFDENVGLEQIEGDWHILSWAAKWLDEDRVMYMDQRNSKDISNDKEILKGIWNLLVEADIVITHNGINFDIKKLNARFVINGMQPPSSFRNIDTLVIAKKKFGFTSNKLEYLTNKLCKKHKKLKHRKFNGYELWKEVLNKNREAWKEMEKYNKEDVLSLEELYKILIPWDSSINFSVYNGDDVELSTCSCGNEEFLKWGYTFSNNGKYQRYRCSKCGATYRGKENKLSLSKRKNLKVGN